MKILISSHLFSPSVGGVEAVGLILAEEFAALGNEVRVVTQTVETSDREFPFQILRRPRAAALLKAVHWCDLFLHNNISLQTAWPLAVLRRPWLIVHHTWISRPDGECGWQDRLKKFVLRFGHSIAISQAIADSLPVPSRIIRDPYDDQLFRETPGAGRTADLIFVGRLVSDKGMDLLIDALGTLKQQGLVPGLTVVGSGPERKSLQVQAQERGVGGQITFVGPKVGRALVELLNQHRILVVPSRWQEPFGLVALEGIACGCVVVGSSGGGLKDAIGPCGVTFPNGDLPGLVAALSGLLACPEKLDGYKRAASEHLAPHRRRTVAQAYWDVMEGATQEGSLPRVSSARAMPAWKSEHP